MKGIIYKITSPSIEGTYYGSTTKSTEERLRGHYYDLKNYQNGKGGLTSSFTLLENKDAICELVEEVECLDIKELKRKEGEYQLNNECVNKVIAGRTKQESDKNYRENNKEKLNQYFKEYHINNKEKRNKQSNARYYKNKDDINKKRAEIYKNTEKITCECGAIMMPSSLSRHKKRAAHIDKLKKQ